MGSQQEDADHSRSPLGATAEPRPGGAGEKSTPVEYKYDSDAASITETREFIDGQSSDTEVLRDVRPVSGRSVMVDRNAEGSIDSMVEGQPSDQGESELWVARLLVETLNNTGCHWGNPVSCDEQRKGKSIFEDGVDCLSTGPDGDLKIQVTTAEIELQAMLHRTGRAERHEPTIEQRVDAIWATIQKKQHLAGREDIVLAVDGAEYPDVALRSVVSRFRDKHGSQAGNIGFEMIWMVGPTTAFVQRLDFGTEAG